MLDKDFWSSETGWFYVSLLLAGVLVFQLGQWYGQSNEQSPTTSNTDTVQQVEQKPQNFNKPAPTASLAPVPDWVNELQTNANKKALGDPDAPLTVVEYLDIQCPFCQRYTQNTFPKIRKNYIETGKVYYKIKHFPLRIHDKAIPAANAAECAADQDKFWAFKSVIMNSDRSLNQQTFLDVANHIGIDDMTTFKSCVNSMKYRDVVNQEKADGSKKGASATPTVFVGDTKIEGAQPYSNFKKAIESQL
jgi:protein-disulfide isomerase